MSRSTKEWIGKTPDAKVPPRVRLRILEAYNRCCYLSGNPIPPGAAWELEHKIALILGGEHRESNLAPALVEPHKRKTTAEMAVKAKIADIAKRAYGIKTPPKRKIVSAGFPKRVVTFRKPILQPRDIYARPLITPIGSLDRPGQHGDDSE